MRLLRPLLAVFLLVATAFSLRAVEIVTSTNSYYNTSDTISLTLPSWSSGWGSGGDGWNYVGQVNGASAIYLGDGWVLTAGHVGSGTFTLDGYTYTTTGVSYSTFTNSSTGTTNADLTLFQISTTSTTGHLLSLSSLTITSSLQSGSTDVIIGYGGGSESWGINTITATNQLVSVSGYLSVDYSTAYGTTGGPGHSTTNNAELVTGDSGGANFVNVSGTWELAGINEAVDTNTGTSYFVQLSTYQSQITAIMSAVPEPGTWALLGLGLLSIMFPTWQKWGKQRKG